MSDIKTTSRLRTLLHSARAAHQRSSDEWIRRMEAPAHRGQAQRL